MVKELLSGNNLPVDRCKEISPKDQSKLLTDICVDMKDTMKEKGLKTLSANQIGYLFRVVIADFDGKYKTYVNPVISRRNGMSLVPLRHESVDNDTYLILCSNDIDIAYQTQLGCPKAKQVVGKTAAIFETLIDLLDCKLLSDIGMKIDDDYFNATEEERFKINDMYLQGLEKQREALNESIKEDVALNEMSNAIKFMAGVQSGQIEMRYDPEVAEIIRNSNKELEENNKEIKDEQDI